MIKITFTIFTFSLFTVFSYANETSKPFFPKYSEISILANNAISLYDNIDVDISYNESNTKVKEIESIFLEPTTWVDENGGP